MNNASPVEELLIQKLSGIDAAIRENRLPDAAKALNEAQKLSPGDPRLLLLGAQMAEKSGNLKGALELMCKAVQNAPQWSVSLLELSRLLARNNQFAEAFETVKRAIALGDPNEPVFFTTGAKIAREVQAHEQRLAWLQEVCRLLPENNHFKMEVADCLGILGREGEMLAIVDEVLQRDPNNAHALFRRMQHAAVHDQQEAAIADSDALASMHPENTQIRLWGEISRGQTPQTLPAEFIQELFDDMAATFDQHLVRRLRYRAPLEVAEKIRRIYPDLDIAVLDLGSGTGLLGVCLGGTRKGMVGVELSHKMIEQAARHNLYARFHTVNLLDALHDSPTAEFEVITALDVLIYVGDLSQAIPDAHRVLKPGGAFIFTCEEAPEDGPDCVFAPKIMRYAHKRSHIAQLCRDAGFSDVSIEDMNLRLEAGEPVKGFLVIARKSA